MEIKNCQDCGIEVKVFRKLRCLNCYRHFKNKPNKSNKKKERIILNKFKKNMTNEKIPFDIELQQILGVKLFEEVKTRFN